MKILGYNEPWKQQNKTTQIKTKQNKMKCIFMEHSRPQNKIKWSAYLWNIVYVNIPELC